MDSILQGLPHVICYLDDTLVTGVTETDHLENLEEVLRQLKENEVTLKREKCSFFNESVEYLGKVVDGKGVHTSQRKLRKLQAVL